MQFAQVHSAQTKILPPARQAIRLPVGSRRPDSLAYAAGDVLEKALRGQGRAGRPKGVRHFVSESIRRYTQITQGIVDDATPHLDAVMLRNLAKRNVAMRVVINTILTQVAAHFVKPLSPTSIGLKVRQKDTKKALTAAAAREIERVERILFLGGVLTEKRSTGEPGVWDGNEEETADPLNVAVRKLMLDSLVLDRAFIRIEGNLSGRDPVMFWKHTDGGLIRLADPDYYIPQIRNGCDGTDDLAGRVKYVQLAPEFDFKVDREYAWNEGLLGIRNPKTELLAFGLGDSEVEQALMALTGILYTLQSNSDWFTNNHVPQGFVTIFGNFQPDDVETLRSQLAGELGVLGGSIWEVPVLAAQPMQGNAVEWTPFVDRTRMDMVSQTFFHICVALMCGVFQIAPEECGFHSQGGPASTIGGDGGAEDKLQHSQHKGLLPRVLWLVDILSRIVEMINPDLEAVIQGLDAVYNPEQVLKEQQKQMQLANGATINDLRALNDEPPVVDAIDEELWDQIKETHENRFYGTERERVEAMVAEYKKKGGRLGNYPNAPVGNPGAMQVWIQEHMAEQQQTQAEMGQMAGQEQQNQWADQQAEKQGAQADMQAFGDREDEFQRGEDAAGQQAAQANELRIPMKPNALAGLQGGPGAFQKAIRVERVRREED